MESSQIRDQTRVSCIGKWILYHWATSHQGSPFHYPSVIFDIKEAVDCLEPFPALTIFSTKWLPNSIGFQLLGWAGTRPGLNPGAEESPRIPLVQVTRCPQHLLGLQPKLCFLRHWSAHSLANALDTQDHAGHHPLWPPENEGVVPSICRWGGRLLFSKRDTSLFSWARIMFHLADLAPHLNSIPQANNTIKQMERRFSNNKFHRTGHSFVCSFKRRRTFRRINHPESHGLKHYIETASKNWLGFETYIHTHTHMLAHTPQKHTHGLGLGLLSFFLQSNN